MTGPVFGSRLCERKKKKKKKVSTNQELVNDMHISRFQSVKKCQQKWTKMTLFWFSSKVFFLNKLHHFQVLSIYMLNNADWVFILTWAHYGYKPKMMIIP